MAIARILFLFVNANQFCV